MGKYDVHLFPVMRFTVRNVEAESMEEACKIAAQDLNDRAIKHAMCGHSDHETEYADDLVEAVVYTQGGEDYLESAWFEPQGKIWRKKA